MMEIHIDNYQIYLCSRTVGGQGPILLDLLPFVILDSDCPL